MPDSDDHGKFNETRLLARSCESLIGICNGLVADDELNQKELAFLSLWLRDNEKIAAVWPGSVVAARVESIYSDGTVTSDELLQLKSVLVDLVGGTLAQTGAAGGLVTALPIDRDAAIIFEGRSFCFTGKFLFGTRKKCCAAISALGGIEAASITNGLHYLVVGTLVSPDWMFSSHGRKIEAAVEARGSTGLPKIVSEDQWVKALGSP